MEFWGIEVKAGQTIKCNPAINDKLLHLSQASLGEIKKDKTSESIPLSVKVGDQKFVIGTLSSGNFPHMSFDLIFEREFELCHGSKTDSVYFCGYYMTTFDDEEPEEFTDTDSDSDEENALLVKENGNKDVEDKKQKPAAIKVNGVKSEFSNAKSLASITESKKSSDTSADDESEEEDLDDEMATSESEDESDDESSDEDAAAQKKVETGKKRPVETVAKTLTSEKKAKLAIQNDQTSGNKDVEDKKQKSAAIKVNGVKSEFSDAKSPASITESEKSSEMSDDDESEEEDSDDEMAMSESEDESDESDDESSDEDAAAQKVGTGEKSPVKTVEKTPTSKKKATLA